MQVGPPPDKPTPIHPQLRERWKGGRHVLPVGPDGEEPLSQHRRCRHRAVFLHKLYIRSNEQRMSPVPKFQPGERRFSLQDETNTFTSNQAGRKKSNKMSHVPVVPCLNISQFQSGKQRKMRVNPFTGPKEMSHFSMSQTNQAVFFLDCTPEPDHQTCPRCPDTPLP